MISIIIGILMIIGGLSGHFVLIGTQSGVALAVLGAVLVVWGIIKVVRRSQGGGGGTPKQ